MPTSDAPFSVERLTTLVQRLDACTDGERNELFEAVYHELKSIARRRLAGERPDHTLGATALVSEGYLRVFDGRPRRFDDLGHFMASVSLAMRNVLVDWSRRRGATKRTPPGERVLLDEIVESFRVRPLDPLAMDGLLDDLRALDEQQWEVVNLRVFGNLTLDEIAAIFGTSRSRVQVLWAKAKDWLERHLRHA